MHFLTLETPHTRCKRAPRVLGYEHDEKKKHFAKFCGIKAKRFVWVNINGICLHCRYAQFDLDNVRRYVEFFSECFPTKRDQKV